MVRATVCPGPSSGITATTVGNAVTQSQTARQPAGTACPWPLLPPHSPGIAVSSATMVAQSLSITLLAGTSADPRQSDVETAPPVDACAPNALALTGTLVTANAITTLIMVRVRIIAVSLRSQRVYR